MVLRMVFQETLIGFLISWAVSTIIIFAAAKLLGEREGIATAVLAALIGAVIFWLATYLLGYGLLASLIAGFFWLLALGSLYNMGWLKALLVAIVIWVFSIIVSWVLPTLSGPL